MFNNDDNKKSFFVGPDSKIKEQNAFKGCMLSINQHKNHLLCLDFSTLHLPAESEWPLGKITQRIKVSAGRAHFRVEYLYWFGVS